MLSQEQSFFLQTLLFMAFLVTVLNFFKKCTFEHMILGQLRMRTHQTKKAPLEIVKARNCGARESSDW